jgi:hypothetical protein
VLALADVPETLGAEDFDDLENLNIVKACEGSRVDWKGLYRMRVYIRWYREEFEEMLVLIY